MWVQFQLGLHLLKVNCVICCFFWKIKKKFPFCKKKKTFVFWSLSLEIVPYTIFYRLDETIQGRPGRSVFGHVLLTFPASERFDYKRGKSLLCVYFKGTVEMWEIISLKRHQCYMLHIFFIWTNCVICVHVSKLPLPLHEWWKFQNVSFSETIFLVVWVLGTACWNRIYTKTCHWTWRVFDI